MPFETPETSKQDQPKNEVMRIRILHYSRLTVLRVGDASEDPFFLRRYGNENSKAMAVHNLPYAKMGRL